MLTDKEAKKKYISEFHKESDKYYATVHLKSEGFSRHICIKCSMPFWSTHDKNICGDPACGTIPYRTALVKKTKSAGGDWTRSAPRQSSLYSRHSLQHFGFAHPFDELCNAAAQPRNVEQKPRNGKLRKDRCRAAKQCAEIDDAADLSRLREPFPRLRTG